MKGITIRLTREQIEASRTAKGAFTRFIRDDARQIVRDARADLFRRFVQPRPLDPARLPR